MLQSLLQTRVQDLERGKAFVDGCVDGRANLDALREQVDGIHIGIGKVVTFDDVGARFAMRRLDLKSVALEIVYRNGLERRIQCLKR